MNYQQKICWNYLFLDKDQELQAEWGTKWSKWDIYVMNKY